MSLSALTCPHCVGSFLVDSSMAGQEALCPNCKGMVLIPPIEEVPPAASTSDATAQFACPVCFQPFAALASMAGQRVMCPHCGSTVIVPHSLGPEVQAGVGSPAQSPPAAEPPPSVPAPPPSYPPPPSSAVSDVSSVPSPPPFPPPTPLAPPTVRPPQPTTVVESAAPPKPPSPSSQPSAPNRPVVAPPAATKSDSSIPEAPPRILEPTGQGSPTATERPIRKLSPEERARYRLIKNAVVLAICAAVLGALFLALRYVPILKELSQRVEFIYDLGSRI